MSKHLTTKKTSSYKLYDQIKNLKLGFELWEILTAFTLALTIASMLLWFSSLQPAHLQDEFIWHDQAKNQLYNISIKVNNINGSELRAFNLLPSDSVCSSLELNSDLEKTIYEKNKSNLSALNKDLDNIKNESKNRNNYLESTPKFTDVASSFTDEISKADEFLEKKLYISGRILELRKTRDSWCQESQVAVTKENLELVDEINTELEKLTTKKSQELLTKTKEIKSDLENISKDPASFTAEIKSRLVENYKSLWSLQSIQELTEFDKQNDSPGLGRLIDYETWQKKFTENNPKLRSRIVFIASNNAT